VHENQRAASQRTCRLKRARERADSSAMRSSFSAIILAALGVTLAGTSRADVVVHLRSGGIIRADRTWTEGDTVNVQMGNDVASFAPSAIESIEQLPGTDRRAGTGAANGAPTQSAAKSGQHADAHPSAPPAKPTPAKKADLVPTVQGEDMATKLDRLDALSLQTHRELTIARHNGDPEDKQKAIQDKIDEINSQRDDALRRLGRAH
jgi:hypothetical protein